MDESLQSDTMNEKQNYWYETMNVIQYKEFLLVAGGIIDSASMEH